MKSVNLYDVTGSTLVATVDVPDLPEGDQDIIVWPDPSGAGSRFFKIIDPVTYWEVAIVTVL